jgi:hypothetical protein
MNYGVCITKSHTVVLVCFLDRRRMWLLPEWWEQGGEGRVRRLWRKGQNGSDSICVSLVCGDIHIFLVFAICHSCQVSLWLALEAAQQEIVPIMLVTCLAPFWSVSRKHMNWAPPASTGGLQPATATSVIKSPMRWLRAKQPEARNSTELVRQT